MGLCVTGNSRKSDSVTSSQQPALSAAGGRMASVLNGGRDLGHYIDSCIYTIHTLLASDEKWPLC